MSPSKRYRKEREQSGLVHREDHDQPPIAREDSAGSRQAEQGSGQPGPETAPSAFPTSWESPLRQLIREELNAVLGERLPNGSVTAGYFSEPPVPREQSVRRVTRGTLPQTAVDAVLLSLFEEECAKHGGAANRAMEFILWNFFGKPGLSFQVMERLCESRSVRTGTVCLEDTVDY